MSMTQGPPPTVGIDDAFGRAFAAARRDLGDLVDTPTWSLDDTRLDRRLGEALAVRAAADELVARLVAEADDRNLPHRYGASSTRAHLMTAHRMSAGEASRTVRTAKQLHGTTALTEPTRRAVAAGTVSAEQGVVVAAAVNRLSPTIKPDRVEVAQQDLLAHAKTLSYTQLQVAANHLVEVVDPDTVDETLEQQLAAQERKALASAWFTGQFGDDGIARGRFALPNLVFGMLTKHLDAVSAPRRVATGTGTGSALPTETTVADLPYGNRLGRALCELIEHLPTDGHPQRGVANATIVVTVDETKLRNGAGEAHLGHRRRHLDRGDPTAGLQRRPPPHRACPVSPRSSTSAPAAACSTGTNASPSLPATRAASSPAANAHPPGPKHITGSRGARAGQPTSTTDACCVRSTII